MFGKNWNLAVIANNGRAYEGKIAIFGSLWGLGEESAGPAS